MFKHKILQIAGLKLNNRNNFYHLKLWVAVATHNFKWLKIRIE